MSSSAHGTLRLVRLLFLIIMTTATTILQALSTVDIAKNIAALAYFCILLMPILF